MTITVYDSKLAIVLIPDPNGKRSPQEEAFWKFHQKNPMVYEAMVGFARELWRKLGPDAKLVAQRLYWRVRWELTITTLDGCLCQADDATRAGIKSHLGNTEKENKINAGQINERF